MALPNSGSLSLSQIQSEFGGSNPISLSEYYRGGSLVPNHSLTGNIAASGTISVDMFYGTQDAAPVVNSFAGNIASLPIQGLNKYNIIAHGINQITGLFSKGAGGSFNDQTFSNPSGNTSFTVRATFYQNSNLASRGLICLAGNYSSQSFAAVTGRNAVSVSGYGTLSFSGSGGPSVANDATYGAYSYWLASSVTGNQWATGSRTFNV